MLPVCRGVTEVQGRISFYVLAKVQQKLAKDISSQRYGTLHLCLLGMKC
jgi:hypothetical protein